MSGNYLYLLKGQKQFIIEVEYFNYKNTKPFNKDALIENLIKQVDDVFLTAFSKLINYANGRMIIVPLSGGLDSRLVVLFLHRLKYKNVLCCTYGIPGNWESEISRNIAMKAGFKWKMIQYNRKMWHEFIESSEAIEYFLFSNNLSSLPVFQDILAIKQLKNEILVNAILVPGLTGDFLANGHLSENILKSKDYSIESIIFNYMSVGNYKHLIIL
jgi:asparagine synthase (glutamine-hydrolysing)